MGIVAYVQLGDLDTSNQSRLLKQHQSDSLGDWETALQHESNLLTLVLNYQWADGIKEVQSSQTATGKILNEVQKNFPDNDPATLQFHILTSSYDTILMQLNSGLDQNLGSADQHQLLSSVQNRIQSLQNLIEQRRQSTQIPADKDDMATANEQYYLYVSILLFIVAIVLAWLIGQAATRPLRNLDERLRRVADGDLTEPLELRGAAEVVELSMIFNQTIGDLQSIISSMQSQAKAVKAASEQVRQLSQAQAASVSEQAIAISEVSSTLAELSDTSRQIAGSATLVVETARQSLEIATVGYNTMQDAGETMNEIRDKVNSIVESILSLNALTQHIQEITILMNTLSSEMHLLALNAVIESVGAGTEGERFAVVAGHIRKLVQRSRMEGIEIQQLIQQIQRGAVGSVMVTEQGMKIVAVAEKTVKEGFEVNREIIEQAKQTTELAEAISQATEHQRVVSSHVAITIQELSHLFSQISNTSKQYLTSAEELGEVVNQLDELSEMFNVGTPA